MFIIQHINLTGDKYQYDGVNCKLFAECAMKMKGMAKSMDLQMLTYETKMIGQQLANFMEEVTAHTQCANLVLDELRQQRSVAAK